MILQRVHHHQNPVNFHIIEFSDEEQFSEILRKKNFLRKRNFQITSNLSNITMALGFIKTIEEPQ